MSDADGRIIDHVVLPRRRAGLALLERYFPSPADNVLDAELTAFAAQGDTVLDPWAGTGWTARRALAAGMNAVAAEASPFAQLAAQALLGSIEPPLLDAALAQLASAKRVDVPLRQHVEELYVTRCPTCRAAVVGEQFIWPRGGDAPGRKIFRCSTCDLAIGGPDERVAAVDAADLAKLGIERPPEPEMEPIPGPDNDEDLPPAPIGLSLGADPIGEAGGPPAPAPLAIDPPFSGGFETPRYASTVRPEPRPGAGGDVRQSLAYLELRDRFPILDGRDELVDELLALFTPRNLHALQVIAAKIDSEIRDGPIANALRLALAACLLPASRLNGYPGRVASLRISGGHVRQPASRHQREVNVWRLFEDAVADVRTAITLPGAERHAARFAADAAELGAMQGANLLWIRCRPAAVGEYLPEERVDLVLGAPSAVASLDELSFEYLATAFLLGREAAATLRLEPLFGGPMPPPDGAEATALRRGLASAAGALRPGGWCSLILESNDPERVVATAIAGASAGLRLASIVPRESDASGDGVVIRLRKPSAEDRLRDAVGARPLRLGAAAGQLTYPELVEAIDDASVGLLRDRGEPASLLRITCAVLLELQRRGLLARIAMERVSRSGEAGSGEEADIGQRGATLLGGLLREELGRDDHASIVRLEGDRATWWLREPELAESPLADRVEWAAYSLLSTAGGLDEHSFMDRLFRLFPGIASPDEELARACLAAYAAVGERGRLVTEDELARRFDDHSRMIATLVDYGHRVGMRAWIGRNEQRRLHDGQPLGMRLTDEERRAYLPLVIRAPAEVVGEVDVLWYVRGRSALLFEVEWTAMIGAAVLDRGRRIPINDQQARFLVIPAERAELLRLKLSRSPWLRAEMGRQNWHVLKWQHLETIADRPAASLEALEPVLGLDPLIERGGEQLTIFGE
ncbi:MAG: hypothetical protein ABI534_08345 [Chloroflexota bacterium]